MVVVSGDSPPLGNKFPKTQTVMKNGTDINMSGSMFIDVKIKEKYVQCEIKKGGKAFPLGMKELYRWQVIQTLHERNIPKIRSHRYSKQRYEEKAKVIKKAQCQIVPRTDGSRTVILKMWSLGQASGSHSS